MPKCAPIAASSGDGIEGRTSKQLLRENLAPTSLAIMHAASLRRGCEIMIYVRFF